MENDAETSSNQGLLDLSVELSTGDVTAGNEFAIFVLVKNPFSKPVWIQEVNVSLPSELKIVGNKDIQDKIKESQTNYQKENEERKLEYKKLQDKMEGFQQQFNALNASVTSNPQLKSDEIAKLLWHLEINLDSIKSDLRNPIGTSTIDISNGAEVDLLKVGSQLTHVTIGFHERNSESKPPKVKQIEIYEPWLISERESHERIVKLKSSLPYNSALQPGNTAVYTVVLNAKHSLVFTPSKYRLQFYVNYSFARPSQDEIKMPREKTYTNTIAHSLAIRPSVYSVVTGSLIGGTIGAIARLLQAPIFPAPQSILVSLFLSAILGGIAVVFMARKSDAQSFVSVEDFWGGILIGFLVGYTGTSFFESIAGVQIPSS